MKRNQADSAVTAHVMDDPLESTVAELTAIERRAVDWDDGPLLVLAGPGSGKTRVLTCRIARLLDTSRDQQFRILALAFTNKAANDMTGRVRKLVPGLEERADIDTFHGFCAQVLRQHGAHLGIKPDFAIYSETTDRQAVLSDALRRDRAHCAEREDVRLLPLIDDMKARLVEPEQAREHLGDMSEWAAERVGAVAHVYRLYEEELRRANALDFNSLILEAHRLFDGLPLQAHRRLQGRLRVDDPDDFEEDYPATKRRHGTAMASMILHGDLEAGEAPLPRPLYVRPILRPDHRDWRSNDESVHEGTLVVDLLHRSVRRLFEGDGDEPPVAPDVVVINLSIGIRDRPSIRLSAHSPTCSTGSRGVTRSCSW